MARRVEAPAFRSLATETRRLSLAECRAVGNRITGHAAVFNRPSRNLGYIEILNESLLDKVLLRGRGLGNVVARLDHELDLGSVADGRLSLSFDDVGLVYEVEPPDSLAWVVDLVRSGEVTSSSFAFRMLGGLDRWGVTDRGTLLREIIHVGELVDVSPVTDPAYPGADAEARAAQGFLTGAEALELLASRSTPPGDPVAASAWLRRRILPP